MSTVIIYNLKVVW